MSNPVVLQMDRLPDALLSRIESREVVLWVHSLPTDAAERSDLAPFLGLPWFAVVSEVFDKKTFEPLESESVADDPLVRKRGFPQIIDSDPSRISLPQRCLPIYLINGRGAESDESGFAKRLRRMTMLEEVRRSGARELLVIADSTTAVPEGLKDLWTSGFRSYLTVVSNAPSACESLAGWLKSEGGLAAANLVERSASDVVRDLLSRYSTTYPPDRHVIRIREKNGATVLLDVTLADEPERPILQWYSLVEERDLSAIAPEELSKEEFGQFFRDPAGSWRPFAAGLPWLRDPTSRKALRRCIERLDEAGPDESRIAFIAAESGSGGTTLARLLAWEFAREGYPVLVAKPLPFTPDALPLANFLTRLHRAKEEVGPSPVGTQRSKDADEPISASNQIPRYEAPVLIVFDTLHWQNRESELVQFKNELQKSGRPVCILVVTGPTLGLSYYNSAIFTKIAELNHALEEAEALALGRHLNRFLRVFGDTRSESEWARFFQEHTVRYLEGVAAFWVTLSFWIQRQYDLSESIQQWIYRTFKQSVEDKSLRTAVMQVAAFSTEKLPLPEILLPPSDSKWPISLLLEDRRTSLAPLGLARLSADGERYWALIHDVLGRFLVNALFYDIEMRKSMGLESAIDPEQLRFLILKEVSSNPLLGERAWRHFGEDFAVSIFKIDPDQGKGSFALIWRDVLDALDRMPRGLRDSSRVFRHHSAISRRRVAKLDERLYSVTPTDKVALLTRAVEDINYALNFIDYSPGGESNLNLYNSLANAYLDLADAEEKAGSPIERVYQFRQLANDATRRAFAENPTNSYVIETYVKNLLASARATRELAVEACVEGLVVLFSAMRSSDGVHRQVQLGALADQALSILLQQSPESGRADEPKNAVDVLVSAWVQLAAGLDLSKEGALSEAPQANISAALAKLEHPAGQGNLLVLRLKYDLLSLARPKAFREQLDLLEQLRASDKKFSPQLRIEYAVLLYQVGRFIEGDREFRALRRLWRENEYFVEIPSRIRWLLTLDGQSPLALHATVGSGHGTRATARVREFRNLEVPFRPEEHGFRELRPGLTFACYASFGHNGPFLRPLTAQHLQP